MLQVQFNYSNYFWFYVYMWINANLPCFFNYQYLTINKILKFTQFIYGKQLMASGGKKRATNRGKNLKLFKIQQFQNSTDIAILLAAMRVNKNSWLNTRHQKRNKKRLGPKSSAQMMKRVLTVSMDSSQGETECIQPFPLDASICWIQFIWYRSFHFVGDGGQSLQNHFP